MTKLNSYCKHLKPGKIYLAERVAAERIKLARQVVVDRFEKAQQADGRREDYLLVICREEHVLKSYYTCK